MRQKHEEFRIHSKKITEEELQEVAGGIKGPFGTVNCNECYRDAAVHGFVLKRKDSNSLLKAYFPEPLCEECAKTKAALYSPDEWTLDIWL